MTYSSTLIDALPELGGDGPLPDAGVLEGALLSELARVRPSELERGVNLVGPHRDDIDLALGDCRCAATPATARDGRRRWPCGWAVTSC